MKLLVVSHYYYPDVNARAFRWAAICSHWAKLGHEVHVVTGARHKGGETLSNPGVVIHRVGAGVLEEVREWAAGNRSTVIPVDASGPALRAQARLPNRWSLVMRPTLKWIHDWTWKKIYWPDASCLWIWPAWRYSRKLCRREHFDALVTVSHPFSGHLVGLLLKQSLPGVCWLADSGDPFCFMDESQPNNYDFYRKLNRFTEGRLLRSVSHFTVTTEGTADIYRRLFSESRQKISVIPPMLQDVFSKAPLTDQDVFKNDAIVLFFAGTFYSTIRSPRPLLELLERLVASSSLLSAKLQLHVFGPPDELVHALLGFPGLAGRVYCHGVVSHNAAATAMLQATCLVNIGNSTSYQLPSKVIEYMATGKSILNIFSIENDSSAIALHKYPFHLNVKARDLTAVESVAKFVEDSRIHILSNTDSQQQVAKFSSQSISGNYLRLLADM